MTTIMASDDLLGLLELSDEDDNIIEILPKKPKTSNKAKKHKTSLTNTKSKQNKQRNSLSPSLAVKLNKIKESEKKNTKDLKIKIRKNSKKITLNSHKQNKKRNSTSTNDPIKKAKRSSKIITTERRKSKRLQIENKSNTNTNTPKNRRKSKRIDPQNNKTNTKELRRKSKQIQIEHKPTDNKSHRRKSKHIQLENNNNIKEQRRKSKRIEIKPDDKNKNKNKTNRRKSKRINIEIESKSSSQNNRRKSKRIEPTESKSKSLKHNIIPYSHTPEMRRRVSKRIDTQNKSKSLKKPVKKEHKLRITKPIKSKVKPRKSNEFFVDERPRSKSPQPFISVSPPVRPRSKSPQPPIILSNSPVPVPVLRSRSKSPANSPQSQSQSRSRSKSQSHSLSHSSRSPVHKHKDIEVKEMDLEVLYAMYVNIKRYKWNLGSKVEIFSVSQSLWNRGKVTKISRDFQGEYLTVIYDDKQKTLLRGDKHLRAIQIDLSDDKMKEKTVQFIERNKRYKEEKAMRDKNEMFYVGQKCEIKDPKYGWSWCEILEIFRDSKGKFVTIEYKVYDVMHNDAQYKRYHIPIGFKALKASLPRDVGPILDHKWNVLLKTNNAYPQQSTCDHIAARNVELGSMGDFYKRYNISFAQHIPDAVCKLIDSQNIKIFSILILDLENTLIPTKLIRSIKKKNDIFSSRELFMNFDVWCYDTDYKYLKQLQRIMKQTAETMNTFVNNFRGKIMIYSQGEYIAWNNLINCLSESAGGDLWRDIYKKAVNKNGSDIMSIFACKNVYIQHIEQQLDMDDINDIIAAKQLVLEQYFKSIQMGLEYERLKNETYYIPVIFAAGDDKSDQIAVSQAVHGVFQNFYRLVNFELVKNKQKIGDKTLSDNILRQSLFNTMNHPYIQQFMADNDNEAFKKDTWHGLFGGEMQYMHQLEKI